MEIDKTIEKQKADRAAANAPISTGRKDEPWLAEGIVVKVCQQHINFVQLAIRHITSQVCDMLVAPAIDYC